MRRLSPLLVVVLLASLVSACGSSTEVSPVPSGVPSMSASPIGLAVTGHVTSPKGLVTLTIPEDWTYDDAVTNSLKGQYGDDGSMDFVGSWGLGGSPEFGTYVVAMTLSSWEGGDLLETWTSGFPQGPDERGRSSTLLDQGTFEASFDYQAVYMIIRSDTSSGMMHQAIFALGSEDALLAAYLFSQECPTDEAMTLLKDVLATAVITGAP